MCLIRPTLLLTTFLTAVNTLVLHDYFASIEGGGKLSHCLAQHLPAALGYGFARRPHPFIADQSITQYDLQQYSPIPLWQQFKLAHTFAQCKWGQSYRYVIYSGFYTPLAAPNHPDSNNILYCHTPPRFLYDQKQFYLQQIAPPLRPLLNAFSRYLQPRYEAALSHINCIVTNSQHVQARIQHYLGYTARVIYPPCDIEQYQWRGQGDYYLSTARLDPLKRVDQIVRAFLTLPEKRLIVTSGGSELKRLQRLAQDAPNIHFTGWVSEATLSTLIGQAIATLYVPHAEDFGMSPIESMAAGKPVIGVAEGGLLETIIPEQTGLLLAPDFTPETIAQAVRHLTPHYALQLRPACEQQAQRFTHTRFITEMRQLLASL